MRSAAASRAWASAKLKARSLAGISEAKRMVEGLLQPGLLAMGNLLRRSEMMLGHRLFISSAVDHSERSYLNHTRQTQKTDSIRAIDLQTQLGMEFLRSTAH